MSGQLQGHSRFDQGYCKRGATCWFRHVYPDTAAATLLAEVAPRPPSPEEPLACSICLEPPVTFGLLSGSFLATVYCHTSVDILCSANCSHIFCIEASETLLSFLSFYLISSFVQCLRKWRDPKDKGGEIIESRVNKKCPYCRTYSRLIIPSSHYYPDGHQGKAETLDKYKGSLARVHCKYVPTQFRTASGIDVKRQVLQALATGRSLLSLRKGLLLQARE